MGLMNPDMVQNCMANLMENIVTLEEVVSELNSSVEVKNRAVRNYSSISAYVSILIFISIFLTFFFNFLQNKMVGRILPP